MAYLAFYRTFRPTSFDAVVRQEHVVKILKNQIESGKIGHAYLFCGPRGTGKTTLAKIFARAINCEHPVNGSPCGECATCKALAQGASLDVSEIDAASNNGVDEMRELREKVQYPPVNGKYKVYIIDEVHMLTQSAFNAVLKTLEEPPAHAVFVLATTEPQKIPATILSRCMRFDFKLIPQADLEQLVRSVLDKTGKEYENEAVAAIARAGNGSARDSLSIADTCASYSQGKLTYADVNFVLGKADFEAVGQIAAAALCGDGGEALAATEEILSTGKSVGVLLRDLLSFLNCLAIVKTCRNAEQILSLPADKLNIVKELAQKTDGNAILRASEIFAKAEGDLRAATDGRITLETAVMKAAMPQSEYNLQALLARIERLERQVKEGVEVKIKSIPQPAPQPAPRPAQDISVGRSARIEETAPLKESESDFSPFAKSGGEEQQTVFEQPMASSPANAGSLSESDKKTVYARFIRLLRTTRKNAVLFTLCSDTENHFEGDKFVLETTTEAVYKSLNRQENAAYIEEALKELGVFSFEVRLKGQAEDKFDAALSELKKNFGDDIEIK